MALLKSQKLDCNKTNRDGRQGTVYVMEDLGLNVDMSDKKFENYCHGVLLFERIHIWLVGLGKLIHTSCSPIR
ncbi:MAG: hypothetical protein IPQ18_14870 [Saprospiraceae bacterium]|nr:hypothetical protein [Saprospiraceae bacterium]